MQFLSRLLFHALKGLMSHAGESLLMMLVMATAIGALSFAIACNWSIARVLSLLAPKDDCSFRIIPDPGTPDLKVSDLVAIENSVPSGVHINGEPGTRRNIRFHAANIKSFLLATYHPEGNLRDRSLQLLSGRWISSEDEKQTALVGVASKGLLEALGAKQS